MRDNAEGLRVSAEAIGNTALSDAPEEVADKILENIPEGLKAAYLDPETDEIMPIESTEDVAKMLRSNATLFLEGLDTHRDELKDNIATISDNCTGPLKMRAEKAGQLVTVTVCMSPMAPEGAITERAVVERETKIRR
jgi:hypothetical protein